MEVSTESLPVVNTVDENPWGPDHVNTEPPVTTPVNNSVSPSHKGLLEDTDVIKDGGHGI